MNKKDLEDAYLHEALKVKHMRAFIKEFVPEDGAKSERELAAAQLLNIPVSEAEKRLTI